MLKLSTSTKFRKDYKTCIKRGYDMDLLQAVVDGLLVLFPFFLGQITAGRQLDHL